MHSTRFIIAYDIDDLCQLKMYSIEKMMPFFIGEKKAKLSVPVAEGDCMH